MRKPLSPIQGFLIHAAIFIGSVGLTLSITIIGGAHNWTVALLTVVAALAALLIPGRYLVWRWLMGLLRATRLIMAQETDLARYIWAIVQHVSLDNVGTKPTNDDYFYVRLRLISNLVEPLTFARLRGEVKLNDNRTGWWIDFNSAHPVLIYNTLWRGDERCTVVGNDLKGLDDPVAKRRRVSLDVVITLPDGKQLYIKDVQEEPHAEGVPDANGQSII